MCPYSIRAKTIDLCLTIWANCFHWVTKQSPRIASNSPSAYTHLNKWIRPIHSIFKDYLCGTCSCQIV